MPLSAHGNDSVGSQFVHLNSFTPANTAVYLTGL